MLACQKYVFVSQSANKINWASFIHLDIEKTLFMDRVKKPACNG